MLYAAIPVAFTVETRFAVHRIEGGLGGLLFFDEKVPAPYIKDYDGIPGEEPGNWTNRFDLSQWVIVGAYEQERLVGAAAVAPNFERAETAVLWDIRVHTDYRRQRIGRQLFLAAVEYARERGQRRLEIETQNINVPACRFYAALDCELGTVRSYAYAGFPDEVQLIWYKNLRTDL